MRLTWVTGTGRGASKLLKPQMICLTELVLLRRGVSPTFSKEGLLGVPVSGPRLTPRYYKDQLIGISAVAAADSGTTIGILLFVFFMKTFRSTMSRRKKRSNVQSIATRSLRSKPGSLKR